MSAQRVDAHQHFWRLERGDYGWLTPEQGILYRDFEPHDLEPLLRRAGIGRTVLVQAAPTVEETRFLLSLAEERDWIAGVVGWVDLASPGAASVLAELASHPRFVGVRPMIQDLPDPDWMLGPELTPAFQLLEQMELCFDALVRPVHLTRLRELLERHPQLCVVVDHAAKPGIAGGDLARWRSDLARIADETGAFCKLSGLVTEADPDWSVETLRPVVDHLLDRFGADRLLWGSDWPVVELAGGFEAWQEATEELLQPLAPAECDAILGGNAIRFYGLPTLGAA